MEKDRDAQQAFANIAEDDLSDGKIVAEIEKFTCKFYGTKRLTSVDEAFLWIESQEFKQISYKN